MNPDPIQLGYCIGAAGQQMEAGNPGSIRIGNTRHSDLISKLQHGEAGRQALLPRDLPNNGIPKAARRRWRTWSHASSVEACHTAGPRQVVEVLGGPFRIRALLTAIPG